MPYRRPTYEEFSKRAANIATWVGIVTYAAIGLLSYWLAYRLIHDAGWFEVVASMLWLPIGLCAWMVRGWLEQALTGWVPDDQS